jgi:pimeloyl-ACP methyl ester carboxylesterase
MSADIAGSTEQLLVQFGSRFVGLNVWLIEPAGDPVGTVFCLHNFAGNGLDFAGLANFLARNGYRVVCPDLLGRGRSEPFPDVQRALPQLTKAVAAVIEKYSAPNMTIIGLGWGAAVALAALGVARLNVGRFIGCNIPLDFSIEHDPVIQHEIATSERTFGSQADALAYVLMSPEFAGCGLTADEVKHRVRAAGDMFRMNYDPVVLEGLATVSGRVFDLRRSLAAFSGQTLLLNGTSITPSDLSRMKRFEAKHANVLSIETGSPRVLLRSPAEMLIVLGFLIAGTTAFGGKDD